MTDTKQCCGNCRWFKAHVSTPLGTCEAPIPEAAQSCYWMDTGMGVTCLTFRQRGERLPQRFLVWIGHSWNYGICWPMSNGSWSMQCLSAHGTFTDDPAELIDTLFGDAELEWIDRDYGWKDVTA